MKKNLESIKAFNQITWSRYEDQVFEACKIAFPNALVEKNAKVRGRFSGRSRQIDVLITEMVGGQKQLMVVDCKLYNKKADIKKVESFIAMVADIGAEKGLMISERGYTESALKRAYFNPEHIELDIFSLKELRDLFHGECAIPYSRGKGVILVAPLGWIVDAKRREGSVCMLYQRGLTLDEAVEEKEFAYCNFWHCLSGEGLNDLLKEQEAYISDGKKVNYIKYIEIVKRNDAKTVIRIADIDDYPAIELTGFVEFKEFIFFCVYFSREVNLKRNLRKLENIISYALPITLSIN
jgi:hypothetical protein